MAADGLAAETAGSGLLWLCIPFAGLLLCIAVLPLVKPEWWEEHQPHAVALWSVLFAVPFAVMFGAGAALETILECLINDYLTFIILLFGLFCVSGNITMTGDLAGWFLQRCERNTAVFLAFCSLAGLEGGWR